MAAHKYWRVVIKGAQSSDVWLDEVSFRSAAGVDLSTGGVAISGGDYSTSCPASAAFDKSLATEGWASTPSVWPAWIGYNHPTPVDVAYVLVTCPDTPSAYDELPRDDWDVNVQWSDNGTLWVDWGVVNIAKRVSGEWLINQVVRLEPVTESIARSASTRVFRSFGDRLDQRPVNAKATRVATWQWEVQTTGKGRIAGVVTIENIPGSRKVRLYRKHDGMLMRETWSATNGAYSFENLDPNWEYFVVAHDHLRVHNAVVSDMIDPP